VDSESLRSNADHLYGGLGRRMRYGVPPPEVLSAILMRSALPENDINLARMLVSDGADVNQPDDEGNTPLMYAITNGMSEDLVQLLIESGADPNEGAAESPLMVAVTDDRIQTVEALLRHGADPSSVDLATCSEVMVALIEQHNSAMAAAEEAAANEGEEDAAEAAAKAEAAAEAAKAMAAKATAAKAAAEAEAAKEMAPERLEEMRTTCVSNMIPALIALNYDSQHEAPRRRALVGMAYIMEQSPPAMLKALPESTVFSLLGLLEQLFADNSLATALLALRLVQAVLRCKVPLS
jgi:hypothetical protein